MFSFALNDVLFHLKPARPLSVFPDTLIKGIDAQLATGFFSATAMRRQDMSAASCFCPLRSAKRSRETAGIL